MNGSNPESVLRAGIAISVKNLETMTVDKGIKADELLAIASFYPVDIQERGQSSVIDIAKVAASLGLDITAVQKAFKTYREIGLLENMGLQEGEFTMHPFTRTYLREQAMGKLSNPTKDYLHNNARPIIIHMVKETMRAAASWPETTKYR
jgi:hypothetical protein